MAVMIQEAHLPVDRLTKARTLVHRLLPAYSLFVGRPQQGPGRPTQIQVVTLVHVYMAARASLLDVRTQYAVFNRTGSMEGPPCAQPGRHWSHGSHGPGTRISEADW